MRSGKLTQICLLALLCAPVGAFGQSDKATRQAARQEANRAARIAQQVANMPPILQRLFQMSPEQRAEALGKLPPAQRQRIARLLENFSKQPPEQQERMLAQQQRLMALAPERRDLARQALQALRDIQPPRRGIILMELQRLGAMNEEQRTEYVNARRFRARYSEAEIQMMNSLRGVVP